MQQRKEQRSSKHNHIHHQAPLEEFDASLNNSSASSITCSTFWSSTHSSALSFDRNSAVSLLSSFSNSVSSTSLAAAGGDDDKLLNSKRWLVSSHNATGDTSKSALVHSPPRFQRVGASLRLLDSTSEAALSLAPPVVCAAHTATTLSSSLSSSSPEESGGKYDSPTPPVPLAAWQLREQYKKQGKKMLDISPKMPTRSSHDDDHTVAVESDQKREMRSSLSNTNSNNPSTAPSNSSSSQLRNNNLATEATRKELAPKPAHSLPAAFQSACSTRSTYPLIGVSRWDNSTATTTSTSTTNTTRGDKLTSTKNVPLGGRTAPSCNEDVKSGSNQGTTKKTATTTVDANPSSITTSVVPSVSVAPTHPKTRSSSWGGRTKSRLSPDTVPSPPSHSSSPSSSKSPQDNNKKKDKSNKKSHAVARKPLRRHKSDHRRRSKSIHNDSLFRILEEGEPEDITSPPDGDGEGHRIIVERKSCPNIQVPTLFTQWETEFGRHKK
jgi:hypothetical protein